MQRRLRPVVIGLALAVTAPAQATVLAVSSASLAIQIATLPPIALAWDGTGSADVTSTSITGLTAGILSYSGVIPITDPNASPIMGISAAAANGVGGFSFDGAGNGGGLMGVQGAANICVFGPCTAPPPANIVVPFTSGGVNGIGLGGAPVTATGIVNVTVVGGPWTTGTISFCTTTASGTAFDPLTQTVTLVTPATIQTSLGASAVIPAYAAMTLQFVPEPGTLLLLASGVVGVALLGRRLMGE